MACFKTATWKTGLQIMRSGISSLVNRKIILRYTNVRVKTPRNFNFGIVQKTRRKRDMYDVTCDVMGRVSSSFRFLRLSWSKFSTVSVLLENRARTEVTVKSKSMTDRRQIHTNRCCFFFMKAANTLSLKRKITIRRRIVSGTQDYPTQSCAFIHPTWNESAVSHL